jgi:hypothetical protein
MEDSDLDFLYTNTVSIETSNNKVDILNQLFAFKEEKKMDECILDVIIEFCRSKGYNPEEVAQELSEYKGFVDMVEQDLIKYKYAKSNTQYSLADW